jgi:stage V sporulation protein S
MSEQLANDLIKVSGSSDPQSVGSVIARAVVAGEFPKIRAIGANAVNQAVKSLAIARGFVAPRGLDLLFLPGFEDIEGDSGDTISAMSFKPVLR